MGQMPEFAQELIITYNKRVYVEFLPELSQLFLILRFFKPYYRKSLCIAIVLFLIV